VLAETSLAATAPSRARAWAGRALLGVVLLAVVAADPSPLRVVAGLFVLVVPFEKLFPRHRRCGGRASAPTWPTRWPSLCWPSWASSPASPSAR